MGCWPRPVVLCALVAVVGARPQDDEPYCTRDAVLQSKLDSLSENATEVSSWSTALLMSLNDTACFMTRNDSRWTTKHAIKFVRVEHHYSIAGTYKFGIPLIKQTCLCDCQDSEQICKVEEYQYKNCTQGALCFRTLRPHQSSAGCVSAARAELCCQVQLDPFEGWTFRAARLRQPDTVLVLRYRVYARRRGGAAEARWTRRLDRELRFALDRGSASAQLDAADDLDQLVGLELSAPPPHRQLEPGMYFWRVDAAADGADPPAEPVLRGNVRLNEPAEASLDKLGWFRLQNGAWTVRRGLEKVTKAQHVQVENCKAQRYMSSFDAEQFVLETGKERRLNYDLGNVTTEMEPWVKEVRIQERVVQVVHSEGSALELFVKTSAKPGIYRHNSQLGDFSGTIHLDSSSNCYMNLTFRDVRGPLQGEVYADASRSFAELFFHIQAGDQLEPFYRSVVSLPASVNARREVCIHPYGDPLGRECRWLEFVGQPLRQARLQHSLWALGQSECAGCNERGWEAFVLNLDPRRWFDGLNTRMEWTAFGLELGITLVVLMALCLLLFKVLVPMCCCMRWCCTPACTYRPKPSTPFAQKF